MSKEVRRKIPRWSIPLLAPSPLKGAAGGRASGKSHFFAERLIEKHEANPNFRSVCIREVQKSIKFSSFQIIKDKIIAFGLEERFLILRDEIRDRLGNGVIIFQGMQDHTADSIKSLEGFDLAWFEEAQRASRRSLDLLTPTILRKEGAECWFSWNPDQADDAIEHLAKDIDFTYVKCTYLDNPFRNKSVDREAEKMRDRDPDAYEHIWLGGYNIKNDAQIFNGKWAIDEFEPLPSWTPLHGLDWGFSQDPTAGVRCYLENEKLYIHREAVKVGLEIEDTAEFMCKKIPQIEAYEIQADCARPESISHVKRKSRRGFSLPRCVGVKKWSGSVEDGISFIKGLEKIIIHPGCKNMIDEARLYSYKVDKRTDEILPKIVDNHNHLWDAVRYALSKLIKRKPDSRVRQL